MHLSYLCYVSSMDIHGGFDPCFEPVDRQQGFEFFRAGVVHQLFIDPFEVGGRVSGWPG